MLKVRSAVVFVVSCSFLCVGVGVPAARAETGGTISLASTIRVIDTRAGAGGLQTDFIIPSSRILSVILTTGTGVDDEQDGTAVVHPCDVAADQSEPTFVITAAISAVTKLVTGVDPTCITSTIPVWLIVDQLGTIAAAAQPDLVQFVPTPQTTVLDSNLAGGASQTLPRGPIPTTAKGVALLISLPATDAKGYISTNQCNFGLSLSADASYSATATSAIAYVTLADASSAPCIYTSIAAHLSVDVLGYFDTEGPDQESLPPVLAYTAGEVPPPGLESITPVRVLDTRSGLGRPGVDKVPAGSIVTLDFGDRVGAATTAVVLNVTVVDPDGAGYATVYPCDEPRPNASNLNYVAGQTVPNLVTAQLGGDRTVCIFTQARTHLLADLSGTYEFAGGASANPIAPARLLDTRAPIGVPAVGPLAANGTLSLQVAGRAGVPASGAVAATLNVTATSPALDSFLTVWPCDQSRPVVSNLNFTAGQTVPNLVTVKLSATGTICFFSQTSTDVIADVAMWFGGAGDIGFDELAPARILDTREPIGVATAAPVDAGGRLVLQVAGRGGVPTDGATAVALNVTVVGPANEGYVTVWPCDSDRPVVSNLNFVTAQTVPNAVTVKVAADGTVCLFTTARAHLVADVSGYFNADPYLVFVQVLA